MIRWASWGYLVFITALWLTIFFGGDRWWPATLLLFGPRWVVALPLIILIPLASWRNLRSLLPLTLAALIVFGPFMGLCLHTGKAGRTGGPVLRVITCNVDNGNFNPKALGSLIRDTRTDIVALQECQDSLNLPLPNGWQKISERGLVVLSRFPLRMGKTVQVTPPRSIWPGTYLLQAVVHAPGGDIAFCSLQFPTPRFGLQRVLDRYTFLNPSRKATLVEDTAFRWRVAQEARRYIATLSLPVIVAGDFNTPTDSFLYQQTWGGLTNAFSKVGWGYGWTQRVSVHGLPFSARIDHILTGKGLCPSVCETGPDVGSDHLPVIADIRWAVKQWNSRTVERVSGNW